MDGSFTYVDGILHARKGILTPYEETLQHYVNYTAAGINVPQPPYAIICLFLLEVGHFRPW